MKEDGVQMVKPTSTERSADADGKDGEHGLSERRDVVIDQRGMLLLRMRPNESDQGQGAVRAAEIIKVASSRSADKGPAAEKGDERERHVLVDAPLSDSRTRRERDFAMR
jgi:hypothetical protein